MSIRIQQPLQMVHFKNIVDYLQKILLICHIIGFKRKMVLGLRVEDWRVQFSIKRMI